MRPAYRAKTKDEADGRALINSLAAPEPEKPFEHPLLTNPDVSAVLLAILWDVPRVSMSVQQRLNLLQVPAERHNAVVRKLENMIPNP